MNNWYLSLQRPALTPPNWIFGPVWTVLYIMIAVSLALFVKKHKFEHGIGIYFLIAFHLITNVLWTPLFFGLQNPGLALGDIIILDVSLVTMIYFFWQENKAAAILLFPYLVWVLFAAYLNIGFFILNRV